MKNKFVKTWKRSKQRRKQRKYRFNIQLHLKHKMLSANLSKDLRKKYKKRSFPVRKGDTVKVIGGEFKGKSGKILLINTKKLKVIIEGIQKSKKDGTKANIFFPPHRLQITELSLDDKKRIAAIERKNKEKIHETHETGAKK